ncbi:MAG: hypothetical protein U0229_02840 [Anaeromyxobacter sp.]
MGKSGGLILLALGGLVASLAGQTTWSTWQNLSAGPVSATVASAPAEQWITLEDAAVRCDTRRTAGRSAFYEASPKAGGEVFLVQVADDQPCEGLVLQGGFGRDRLSAESIRSRLGVEPPRQGDARVFNVLGPDFMKRALYVAGPLFLLGLATIALGLRRYRASQRQ